MFWIVLFGLILIVGIITFFVKEVASLGFDGELVFMSAMCLVIGSVIVGILSLIAGAASFGLGNFGKYQEFVTQCNLQAIENTQGGHGSFFLGSGTYSSGPYYLYYCKDGNTYQANTVDARDTIIIENDDQTPHVTRVRDNYRNSSHFWTFFNTPGSFDKYKTQITIPKGSVAPDYQLTGPGE